MKAAEQKSAATTAAKNNTPFFNKGGGNALSSENEQPFFAKSPEPAVQARFESEPAPSSDTLSSPANPVSTTIQAKCDQCEKEEDQLQKKDSGEGITIQEKLTIGQPDDPYEKEADDMADKVLQKQEQGIAVQTKLNIGEPGDVYEKEADAVADKVIQKLAEPGHVETTENKASAVQLKCNTCDSYKPADKEEGSQKEEEEQQQAAPEIRRMAIEDAPPVVPPADGADDNGQGNINTGLKGNTAKGQPVQRMCRECEEGDAVFMKMEGTIQRLDIDSPPGNGSREAIVAAAKSQIGKVEAKHDDGGGKRVGAKYLLEYFHKAAPGVWDDSIIETAGANMPSWCGIFSVWAHKQAGLDIGNWQMGRGVSAFGKLSNTSNPQPGDIGYIHDPKQHHCIVVKVDGSNVHSIDGNSGLFSEVKENIRPLSAYTLFMTAFNGSAVQTKADDTIQQKNETGTQTASGNVESRLTASKGTGDALPDEVRSGMENNIGADFSNVKIHTGSDAVQMSKDLHAQAFTHGSDIYFNSGKYDTDSKSGQHLLAHELTHTVQQGAALQKKEVPSIQKADAAPDPKAEPKFIVVDTAVPQANQLTKTKFLKRLNTEICVITDAAFSGTPFSTETCPYISKAFAKLYTQTPKQIEDTLLKYEPKLKKVETIEPFFEIIRQRVKTSVDNFLSNGDLSGVPDVIAQQIPEGILMIPRAVGLIKSGVSTAVSTAKNILKGIAGIFFKEKTGGARPEKSPVNIMRSLGEGKSMEPGIQQKMEGAFGSSFSNVKVHTDQHAQQMASDMNARAFTVGNHIAFGGGEHQPGSIAGDALMAHELAHVQQQRSATTGINLKEEDPPTDVADFEKEADMASSQVVSSLYLQSGEEDDVPKVNKSKLKIQRCGPSDKEYKETAKVKIEEYETDKEGQEKFKDTKDSLFKLDVALAKEFAELTGPSFWHTTVKVNDVQIQLKKMPKFNAFVKKLEDNGLSLDHILDLLNSIRKKAMYKVLTLLEKNENILTEEGKRYEKDEEVEKLAGYLRGYTEKFDKNDEGRAKAVIRLLSFFEIDRPHKIYGDVPMNEEYKIVNPGVYQPSELASEMIRNAGNVQGMNALLKKVANPVAVRQGLVNLLLYGYNEELYITHTGEYHEGKKEKVEAYIDKTFPELAASEGEDVKMETELRSKFEDFPILADTTLNMRMLSKKDNGFIKWRLKVHIDEKINDIQNVREKLVDDPDKVFELKPLMMLVMSEEGISKDDPMGIIINDKIADVEYASTLRSIALGAIGIALAIAGFFTGGATWWVSAGLVGAGVAVSAIDLYYEAKQYSFHSSASNVGFSEAEQLSEKPGAFGLFMAILGLAIDIGDIFKLFKAAKGLKSTVNSMPALKEAEKIEEAAGNVYDELKAAGQLKEGVEKADFVTALVKRVEDNPLVKPLPEEFVRMLGDLKYDKLEEFMQVSLRKMYETNPATLEFLVKSFKADPEVLSRLCASVAADPNLTGAFFHIKRLLPDDKARLVFRYLGSVGAEEMGNMPNALSVIIRGNITDPELITEVLTNRQLMVGIWNKVDEPELFNHLWTMYKAKKAKGGANYPFLQYVNLNGVPTKLVGDIEVTLAKEMGAAFEALTTAEKNLALLAKTEANLAAELAKPITQTSLPVNAYNRLKALLDKDIIGSLTKYNSARTKLIEKINAEIAASVDNFDDYKKIMKLTQQNGSVGALGEAIAKKFNIPPGASRGTKVSIDIDTFKHPKWTPGGNTTRVIIDNFLAQVRKIGEVKVGTSFKIEQFQRYDFLVEFQNDAVVKTALEKAFKDAGVPAGQIKGISYALTPGADDILTVEKAAAAGTKIVDPVEKRALSVWTSMLEKTSDASKLELHFVTVDGKHYKFGSGGKKVLVQTIN